MKRAAIVYRSHTGTTKRMAQEIGAFLQARGIEAQVVSVGEVDVNALVHMDFLFLGSWTSGLFVVAQHPDEPFVAFARDLPPLPALEDKRVALFTTYRLVTGSMFGKMRAALAGKTPAPALELKSRDGTLSAKHRRAIEEFLGAAR